MAEQIYNTSNKIRIFDTSYETINGEHQPLRDMTNGMFWRLPPIDSFIYTIIQTFLVFNSIVSPILVIKKIWTILTSFFILQMTFQTLIKMHSTLNHHIPFLILMYNHSLILQMVSLPIIYIYMVFPKFKLPYI